jgi:hypothetical protein
MNFDNDAPVNWPLAKKGAVVFGLFVLVFTFGWLQHTFGGYWWTGCVVPGVGLFFAIAWDLVAIAWDAVSDLRRPRTGKLVKPGACPTCKMVLPAPESGAGWWRTCPHCGGMAFDSESKPGNLLAGLLGGVIAAGLGGLAYLFWLLQQTHGGFWWIGIVGVAVSPAILAACMMVSLYGLHKTGGKVHPGACPNCTAPLPALGTDAGRWQSCPRCGVPVVNVAALTFGLSQCFVWCKRVLLGLCVLLSPVVFVSGIEVLLGVGRFLGGRHFDPPRDGVQLLHAALAFLAYCFLAVATGLFGRAAFLGGWRRPRILMAFGALLTAGLLTGVVVYLCLAW